MGRTAPQVEIEVFIEIKPQQCILRPAKQFLRSGQVAMQLQVKSNVGKDRIFIVRMQ